MNKIVHYKIFIIWINGLCVNFKFYLKNSDEKMLTSKINFIKVKIF